MARNFQSTETFSSFDSRTKSVLQILQHFFLKQNCCGQHQLLPTLKCPLFVLASQTSLSCARCVCVCVHVCMCVCAFARACACHRSCVCALQACEFSESSACALHSCEFSEIEKFGASAEKAGAGQHMELFSCRTAKTEKM